MIVVADIIDAEKLSAIALESKAYWGYSKELIESWREDLTVSSKMVNECFVFKFISNNEIVGFYLLNPPVKEEIELEMLFVLPEFIGKGIGNQLLLHAFKKAKGIPTKSMTLLADPNAVPFYKSKGFYEIDQKESSILNRFLPVMKKDLEV
jgi:N-acetylglutamate synthase-like GNAT family acetyltransferase